MSQLKIFNDGKASHLIYVKEDGAISRSTTRIKLSAELGHFYLGKAQYLGGSGSNAKYGPKPRIITATGFDYINRHAPLSWIPQPTLFDEDGKEVGNPLIKRDKFGCVESVRIRRFAVGRGMDGALRCHDLTLTYSPLEYLWGDIINDYNGGAPDAKLKGSVTTEDSLGSGKARVPMGPGVFLVFDAHQSQALKRFGEYRERSKFADRLARTICERNILIRHLGMRTLPDSCEIVVHCWQGIDIDPEKLAKGIVTKGGLIEIDGEKVAVEAVTVAAGEDDLEAMRNEVVDEDGQANTVDTDQEPQGMTVDQIKAALRQQIKNVGTEKFKKDSEVIKLLADSGVGSVGNIAACEDEAVLDKFLQLAMKIK